MASGFRTFPANTFVGVKWGAGDAVLVVDIAYGPGSNGDFHPLQFPTIPINAGFFPDAGFNWFDCPNLLATHSDGVTVIEQLPLITIESSGTVVTQNSEWRETLLIDGGAAKPLLATYYMWQQARLDWLAEIGVPVGTSGNGTLYFNLSRLARFFKADSIFKFLISFPMAAATGPAGFKLRVASYRKKETFVVFPRATNDDLDPAWNFYSEAVSFKAGTNAAGPLATVFCDLKTLDVSTSPDLDGVEWT